MNLSKKSYWGLTINKQNKEVCLDTKTTNDDWFENSCEKKKRNFIQFMSHRAGPELLSVFKSPPLVPLYMTISVFIRLFVLTSSSAAIAEVSSVNYSKLFSLVVTSFGNFLRMNLNDFKYILCNWGPVLEKISCR